MIAVSNAGPLIALAQIGQLEMVHQLFGHVHISQAVNDELISCREQIDTALWIELHQVHNTSLVAMLQERLDVGESETIALAGELNADLVLIDEARGRRVCEAHGFECAGMLGVLMLAKDAGLISVVKPLLEALKGNGFFMSDELFLKVLALANED
jgi:hypothetical protein